MYTYPCFQKPAPKLPPAKFFIPAVILFLLVIMAVCAHAETYSDDQIANAIYRAEGGARAQYAYGIRSVKYQDISEARRICLNTIRNNRKRYADYGHKKYATYLEFLASRYCPVGCDNDRGTNKYWIKNVKFYLAKN